MRIAICYPSFAKATEGKPLLSQNRQFQWYTGAFSYTVLSVVMASAATLLKKMGHEVIWLDYIAEGKPFEEFVKDFLKIKPDLAVFESKTPVIKYTWKIIDFLKKKGRENPFAGPWRARTKFVLCGDHVTARPMESLKKCRVDYVLGGGNYDSLLAKLVREMKFLKSLRLLKEDGEYDLNKMPAIDRELTKWKLYAYNNGNYKYTPGAYTMAGRDCWWRRGGGCSFCSWTGLYPKWRVASSEKLLDEIGYLIDLGVKEVFDDTGTFPIGEWLKKFCKGMIDRGYHKKIYFGCNMRAGVLSREDYILMKKANFRFILYGLESANNKTLEKINKGVTVEQIVSDLKMAKGAGLSPHATIMFGYPWESYREARKTVDLAKKLFNDGVIDSLQATIVIPYPGTGLFEECERKGLLRTKDWDKYDMGRAIMKCPISDEKLKELVRECYSTVLTPKFLMKKVLGIRSVEDVKFMAFSGVKYFSKILDFR